MRAVVALVALVLTASTMTAQAGRSDSAKSEPKFSTAAHPDACLFGMKDFDARLDSVTKFSSNGEYAAARETAEGLQQKCPFSPHAQTIAQRAIDLDEFAKGQIISLCTMSKIAMPILITLTDHVAADRYEETVKAADVILAKCPKDALILFMRSHGYLQKAATSVSKRDTTTNLTLALQDVNATLQVRRTADIHSHRALVLFALKRTNEARDALRAALALDPDHAQSLAIADRFGRSGAVRY